MEKITIGQLSLNILGFSYPDATDPFDADWLDVQVECHTEYADISFSGVYLPYTQLVQFGGDVERVYKGQTNVARFEPMEPNVIIELKKYGSLGGIIAKIELEPCFDDDERHICSFSLDQTFLPEIISSIKSVMADLKK